MRLRFRPSATRDSPWSCRTGNGGRSGWPPHRPGIRRAGRPDPDLRQDVPTTAAVQLARPLVGPSTYLLSLQNGLGNLDRIAAVVGGERALGGVTAHSAMSLTPMVIKYNGGLGGIILGRCEGRGEDLGLSLVLEAFSACGLETCTADDIRVPIWRKLLANCSTNPVAALTGFTGRQPSECRAALRLIQALAQETAAVAKAQSLKFEELKTPGGLGDPHA